MVPGLDWQTRLIAWSIIITEGATSVKSIPPAQQYQSALPRAISALGQDSDTISRLTYSSCISRTVLFCKTVFNIRSETPS